MFIATYIFNKTKVDKYRGNRFCIHNKTSETIVVTYVCLARAGRNH